MRWLHGFNFSDHTRNIESEGGESMHRAREETSTSPKKNRRRYVSPQYRHSLHRMSGALGTENVGIQATHMSLSRVLNWGRICVSPPMLDPDDVQP